MSNALISVNRAKEIIEDKTKKVVILDASIDKVGQQLDNSNLELIPNSLFLDIEGKFSDKRIALPHTMVDSSTFETEARKLGIDKDSTILLYDRWGIYSSPRAWWMFKYMGLEEVYVIDGGLPAWKLEGFEITNSYSDVAKVGNFESHPKTEWIVDINELKALVGKNDIQIIDARSAGRFAGTTPEPRMGLKSGHIPGSKNIPFDQVLNGIYFQPEGSLKPIYADKTSTVGQNIFTCGSGITASILALGAYELGFNNLRVYDGSWSEWGSDPTSIVDQDI